MFILRIKVLGASVVWNPRSLIFNGFRNLSDLVKILFQEYDHRYERHIQHPQTLHDTIILIVAFCYRITAEWNHICIFQSISIHQKVGNVSQFCPNLEPPPFPPELEGDFSCKRKLKNNQVLPFHDQTMIVPCSFRTQSWIESYLVPTT